MPQYAFQPAMHAPTYASALKGAAQSRSPQQLSAAAPEFIPRSAQLLQDFQPLMQSRSAGPMTLCFFSSFSPSVPILSAARQVCLWCDNTGNEVRAFSGN